MRPNRMLIPLLVVACGGCVDLEITPRESRGYDQKICAAFENNDDSTAQVRATLESLEIAHGGEVLLEGTPGYGRFYYRNRDIGYYVIFAENIPAYGSLLETFWADPEAGSALDEDVLATVSSFPGWNDCSDRRQSSISAF